MKAALVKDEDIYSLATRMVKLGFRRSIITGSVNASDRLIDYLKKEFGHDCTTTGRFKMSETFLQTTTKKIEATNFMSVYLRTAKDPQNSDDINEVVDSYEVYRELHNRFRPGVSHSVLLQANEAWTLARDFRADEIRMMICSKCDRHFITPYNCDKANRKHSCPFCDQE